MVTRTPKRARNRPSSGAHRAAADHDDPVGISRTVVASRLVHSGTRSSPSTGGTAASEPVATTTCSAAVDQQCLLAATQTGIYESRDGVARLVGAAAH
jgi:hypothetical protein